MENLGIQGGLEALGDLDGDFQGADFGELLFLGDQFIEPAAFDQLHDDVRLVIEPAGGENLGDVGVVDAGLGPGFVDVLFGGLLRLAVLAGLHQLHGDVAAQDHVGPSEDQPHGAGPEDVA